MSPDASTQKIINTLRLPSGVGATCVLKTPFNSTLDQLAQTLNPSANNSKTLAAQYFDSMCLDSFTQGVPLSNFVPPPPSPAPSDDPDPRFVDGLWNFTLPPPTVRGKMPKESVFSHRRVEVVFQMWPTVHLYGHLLEGREPETSLHKREV